MARRKASPFTSETHATVDVLGEAPAEMQASKVTLVKPVHSQTSENTVPSVAEEAAAADMPARPKFGRAPLRKMEEPKVSLPLPEAPSLPEMLAGDMPSPVSRALSGSAPANVSPAWESRFVFFLLGLFVVINLALVVLLHNHKQHSAFEVSHASVTSPAADSVSLPAPAASAPLAVNNASAAAPAAIAPAAAASAHSAAAQSVPPVVSVASPSSAASRPEKQASADAPAPSRLLDLPSTAPESPAPAAPVNRQGLLSVINKY